jgi:hypothetical protein
LLAWIILPLFCVQCTAPCEAEKILDQLIIDGLDYQLRINGHTINHAIPNRKLKPIFKVFTEEIEAGNGFEKSIYALDTLTKGSVSCFGNQAKKDSIFQLLKSSKTDLVDKKITLSEFFSRYYQQTSLNIYYCQTEKVGIISLDTIYYPRNTTLHFSKTLTVKSNDTLEVIQTISQHEDFFPIRDSLSTYTDEDFITVPLKMEHRNPVTKERNVFKSNVVIGIFDPSSE